MDVKLQIFILISCIITLICIVNMVKKEKLELKYSLLWIIINILIIILCLFPKGIDIIAKLIGVATPINVIFFFGIAFTLSINFSLTIAQSRNSRRIKDLAQKIALLDSRENDKENNKK